MITKYFLIPQDKANHFVYGAILTALASFVIAPMFAVLLALLVAVIKEWRDEHSNGTVESMDVAWTMFGSITVVAHEVLNAFF